MTAAANIATGSAAGAIFQIETSAHNGGTPWGALGAEVSNDLTPQEMLAAAGVDWTVEKMKLTAGGSIVVPEKRALVRSSDNKVLDIVGKEWNPCQNEEAFEFFDDFVRSGDMEMHTAGSLKGGNIVWCLAKVKESFKCFGNDEVESFLLFTNPHKFGQAIDVRFTPIRVVCQNSLTLALKGKEDAVKLNHKKAFDPSMVKTTLGIASEKLKQYEEMARFLGKNRYTRKQVEDFARELFPSYSKKEVAKGEVIPFSRPAARVLELLDEQPGHEHAAGSWWNAFNAVTYFTNHERGSDVDSRLQSSWYGQSKNLNLRALETAINYAEGKEPVAA